MWAAQCFEIYFFCISDFSFECEEFALLSTNTFKFVPENPLPWFVDGGPHLPSQAPSAAALIIGATKTILPSELPK